MSARPIPPEVDCESILPGFDFADAFAVQTRNGLDAPGVTERLMEIEPAWLGFLMRLRDRLTAPFGLKAAAVKRFPVIRQSPRQVLLGFDDRHLDFRIVVDVTGGRASLTTVVRCHNLLGRVYLACVKPFHRIIVGYMVAQLG